MQYVLSTVVQALKDNPDRRFSYAEMVRGNAAPTRPAQSSKGQHPAHACLPVCPCRLQQRTAGLMALEPTPNLHTLTRNHALPPSLPPPRPQSFFSAWWGRQSPGVQAEVRGLVAAGRLDFINGGYVQHDEAAAHYVGMLDQTTRGHR